MLIKSRNVTKTEAFIIRANFLTLVSYYKMCGKELHLTRDVKYLGIYLDI